MTNPITSLHAVEFLIFYGVVIALVIWVSDRYLTGTDKTRLLPLPAVLDPVDPYEVAYLRGGQNELLPILIVRLVESGYLALDDTEARSFWSVFSSTKKSLVQAPRRVPAGALNPMEQEVYDWFSKARTVTEVFEGDLPARLGRHSLTLEERLRERQFLRAEDDSRRRSCTTIVGGAIILGIGGWRFMEAAGREPIGLLVRFVFIGLFMLILVSQAMRLSALGEAYLSQLRERFAGLKEPVGMHYALAAAINGPSALADTPLATLAAEFQQGAWSSFDAAGGFADGCGCGGCG